MAEEIVEKLYEIYRPELVRWCRSMTGDVETAEELVQEAFLRALLHSEILADLAEKQQRAWLYRTVKNLYVDHVRRCRHESPAGKQAQQETAAVSEEISLMEWEELLDSLPDMEGLMFSLRYLQGYTSGQIGEMLGMPAGTVRAKLHEARNHLRRMAGQPAGRK